MELTVGAASQIALRVEAIMSRLAAAADLALDVCRSAS